MLSEQQQRIMGYFIEEAKDHLNTIEQGLLNLKATIEDPEMVHEVFRAAHSVKGGAAMLGLTSIQHTAHRLEDYFKILKECPIKIDQKLESLLLRVYDTLEELLEQLQGPFGLSDDKAEAAMSGVEPVFIELNQHLGQLVAEAGVQPPEDVSLVEVAATAPVTALPSANVQLSQVTSEESALRFILQNDVPAQLREMLQLFKQVDTPDTRQQLQKLCQTIAQAGEQFDLPDWCTLIKQAEQAIINPENTYRTLAPIVIKDIKRAQEQILAGVTSVEASTQLLDLVPAGTESDTELLDSYEFDLFASDDVAATPDDAFAAMFAAEPDNEQDDDLTSLPFAFASDDADAPLSYGSASEQYDDNAADETLDFSLFEQADQVNPDEATFASNHQTGTEVGMAELNSLADLFESDDTDLGLSWQEEVIDNVENGASESLELDATNDFSDLLSQDGSDELSLDETEDLSGLLNNSFQQNQPTAPDELDDFNLAEPDIFADLPESTDLPFELPSLQDHPDQAFFLELPNASAETDVEPAAVEPAADLQSLDELFPELDQPELTLSDDELPEPESAHESLLDLAIEPTADGFEQLPLGELPVDELSVDELPVDADSDFDLAEFDFAVPADLSESGIDLPSDMTIGAVELAELDLAEFDLPDPELNLTSSEQSFDELEQPFQAQANLQPLNDPWDSLESSQFNYENSETAENPFSGLSNQEDVFTLNQVDNQLEQEQPNQQISTDPIEVPTAPPDLEQPTAIDGFDLSDLDDLNDASGKSSDHLADLFVDEGSNDDLGLSSFSFEPVETTSTASESIELTGLDQDLELSADEAANLDFAFEDDSLEFDLEANSLSSSDNLDATLSSLDDLELSFDDSVGAVSADDLELNFDDLVGAASVDEFEPLSPPDAEALEFIDGDIFNAETASGADLAFDQLSDFDRTNEVVEADRDLLTESAAESLQADPSATEALDTDPDTDLDSLFDLQTPDLLVSEPSTSTESINPFSDQVLESELFEADVASEPAEADFDLSLFDSPAASEPSLDFDLDSFTDLPELTNDLSHETAETATIAENEFTLGNEAETDDQVDLNEPADLAELSLFDDTSEFSSDASDLELLDLSGNTTEFDHEILTADQLPNQPDLDFATSLPEPVDLDFGSETSGLESLNFDEEPVSGLESLNFDEEPINSLESLNFDEEPVSGLESLDFDLEADTPAAVNLSAPDEALFDLGLADLDQFDPLGSITATGAELEQVDTQPEFELPELDTDEAELDLLQALTSTDTLELDALDSSDSLQEQPASLDDFPYPDQLSAEAPTGAVAAELSELADLESMLVQETPVTDIYEDDPDDFADLEALLEDVPTASTSAESAELAEPIESSITSVPVEDEFSDLEALLQDTDQMLGIGSSPARKPVTANNRRTNRRSGLNEQTMRVTVKHLDNLNNLVGEMVVNRNSLEQAEERLRQFLDNLLYQVQQLSDVGQRMRDLYERSLLESSLLSGRRSPQSTSSASFASGQANHATGASFDALEMDRFTGFHTLSQEMIELIVRVRESASDIDFVVEETDQVTRNFRQITTQLQEGLTRSRMVPFSQMADRLPRGVRDNSLKYGKQAELIIDGRDTLIDKMIVELLYDPMTHLVNNAIAHGIETPQERVAAGKSPTGHITIRAFHQGNQTVISVSDDGAGINLEAVKAKAVSKGLITTAQAREMSRLDTYDLLFHHGFSTADQVDDLRGRGVGLDVVRSNLNEIRGTISIDSTLGQGTTFTIRLPLTLSISKALCCISNRARIAFPMDGVEDMLDVPKERVQTDEHGRQCIQWRDSLLPFQTLSELLRYNRVLGRGSVYGGNQEEDLISIVVLRSGGNFLALQVDQVLGEQEIVIKQLEGPVPKPLGVAGATVLGDGRIMPIADVLELIDLWQGRIRRESNSSLWEKRIAELPPEPATKTEPTVLIVDDSITVRELLSMTFNKVGYRVEQARDGQEAWEKLRSGLPCDLVFCDIEMPRMDGLELLSRIQKDANLSHLPIAMLTSRGADRHRQMAVQLGAKGYFTKPYLEEVLLDAAQRMLKGEVMVIGANTQ